MDFCSQNDQVMDMRRSSWYKCDSCGCYLDPGEGLLCEECREKTRKMVKESRKIVGLLNFENGQVEMRLEELV